MSVIAEKLAPIIFIFILGLILRKLKVFNQEHADLFLKFAFYISFPSSFLLSIPRLNLALEMIYLPVTAMAIIVLTYFAARIAGNLLKLPKPSLGVFLISSMIMNTGFTFPFFLSAFGHEGFALAALFDLGNTFLIFTFIYFIAIKHGSDEKPISGIFIKLVKNPNLWALFIGLGLNLGQIQMPLVIDNTLTVLANTLTPMFMLSLGLCFSISFINFKAVSSAIAIRMVLGLILSVVFVNIFDLEGLNKIVVIISSAAPAGFTSLTFSSMENLDKQLAASIVSLSVFMGMFTTTLLLVALA